MKSAHVGILVSDLERSQSFYRLLGGEVDRRLSNGDTKIVFMRFEGLYLELIDKGVKPCHSEFVHLAFSSEDVDRSIEDLKAAGVDLGDSVPIDFKGGKIFFFHGPDGEKIELCQGVGSLS